MEKKKETSTKSWEAELIFTLDYDGETMPDECHVIKPVLGFVKKAIKAYPSYKLIGYNTSICERGAEDDKDDLD